MANVRVIPVLLLKNRGLYKTVKFSRPAYVGDPVNTIKIFNDKGVDEIIILDVENSKLNKKPDFEYISDIVSEAFMPVGFGGGISSVEDALKIIRLGVEKVVLNSGALNNIKIVTEIAKTLGSQSTVVAIDVKKNIFGKYTIFDHTGKLNKSIRLQDYILSLCDHGAGEIMITDVEREGTFKGYDLNLIELCAPISSVPVIINGGANGIKDFNSAVNSGASAVAAGSLFIYHGKERGVLINYPSSELIRSIQKNEK